MALFAAPYPSQCTSSLTANWFGGSSLDNQTFELLSTVTVLTSSDFRGFGTANWQ